MQILLPYKSNTLYPRLRCGSNVIDTMVRSRISSVIRLATMLFTWEKNIENGEQSYSVRDPLLGLAITLFVVCTRVPGIGISVGISIGNDSRVRSDYICNMDIGGDPEGHPS